MTQNHACLLVCVKVGYMTSGCGPLPLSSNEALSSKVKYIHTLSHQSVLSMKLKYQTS